MDSLDNWASVGALSASLGNMDRNLDFSNFGVNVNPVKPPNLDCEGRLSELNGMALNSEWMKLMGLSSAGPNGEGDRAELTIAMGPTEEEFGHWRPVYDEKTRPTFSVTGTEIWQTQKAGPALPEKSTEWNLTDTTKNSVTTMESEKGLNREEEAGSEKSQNLREEVWGGSTDVRQNVGSVLDVGSNVDSNTGWGTTPICQEKPWDLLHDRAILEAGPPPPGRQDVPKPRDPSQDSGLDLWRNSLMAGEPVGGLTNPKPRGFDGRSLELFAKSNASDSVALQLELQKLALMESHSPDGLISRSRRGSSVSSIDGISLSSLVGRKDSGVDPNCEALPWVDGHKRLPSQRDEWNHGNPGLQLFTGLQSPSGWSSLSGSEKTPPVVDNGTAVWSRTIGGQEKMSDEDTLAWVKMLRSQSYPPPPSVFDIDMSVPPPPLNAPPMLPPGIVTPAPPGLSLPLLSNLQPSSNLTARQLGSPLSYLAGPGGLMSPSADFSEKQWPFLQQQPVERQRPWTGNQWSNSDQWTSMQRKLPYEATRQHNDSGLLNSDHFRGDFNMHPMQYKTNSTVHSKAPQTRSKLIQQLVSMGFKKEDAQNALITYNMDLKKALAELIAKRSMVTPSPYYDPRMNSLGSSGGQLPPNTDVRDILRSSYGGLPGHAMGAGGGGGLPDTSLDLSKLISSSLGWDALMQMSSNPLQMLQSSRNPLATGHMPPPLPHSSLQFPPTMHPTSRGQDASAGHHQDNLRQLSDLALCRKLAESSRGSLQPDAELLQLFANTLSASNPIVPSRSSAIYSHGNGLPAGLKLPDHLGGAIQGGLFPSPTLGCGPGRSVSVEPKSIHAHKNLDGFDLPSSLIGRQFSLNMASPANQDAGLGGIQSDVSGSLRLSPGDVKLNQVEKPRPKLEIKEFIPGVPWKGAQETGAMMPAVAAVATVFKDEETDWPPKAKETTVVQENSAQKCLPSKWLELKNISDQLDDETLHDLCTCHGQIKVFTRQIDGSLLVSYVNLDDAIVAQSTLDQFEVNGVKITAEFVKDWTNNAGANTKTNEATSLGFITPNGLWIPPDSDGEPAYYGGSADEWHEGFEEAQPEEPWNGEPATSKTSEFEGQSSQEQ